MIGYEEFRKQTRKGTRWRENCEGRRFQSYEAANNFVYGHGTNAPSAAAAAAQPETVQQQQGAAVAQQRPGGTPSNRDQTKTAAAAAAVARPTDSQPARQPARPEGEQTVKQADAETQTVNAPPDEPAKAASADTRPLQTRELEQIELWEPCPYEQQIEQYKREWEQQQVEQHAREWEQERKLREERVRDYAERAARGVAAPAPDWGEEPGNFPDGESDYLSDEEALVQAYQENLLQLQWEREQGYYQSGEESDEVDPDAQGGQHVESKQ